MKVAKIQKDDVIMFPSILKAAEDAGMGRHKFSRKLRSMGRIKVGESTYVFPRV